MSTELEDVLHEISSLSLDVKGDYRHKIVMQQAGTINVVTVYAIDSKTGRYSMEPQVVSLTCANAVEQLEEILDILEAL